MLTWKERPIEHFVSQRAMSVFNKKYPGKVAGSPTFKNTGKPAACLVQINGKTFLAHRIIWTMEKGPIPERMQIDHIDVNAHNNRLDNLRLATNAQNSHNQPARRSNKWGLKGVSLNSTGGKWVAQIMIDGTNKHIGVYDNPLDAHNAYAEAAERHYGDFARTK